MGNTKALLLAGAATALSSAAFAADLPPPPALEPVPYAAAAEFSGWYLRGDVGVGINNRPKLRTSPDPLAVLGPIGNGVTLTSSTYGFNNLDLSSSALVSAGIGYQFNSWFRFDVTGEYRGGAHLSGSDQYNSVGTYVGGVPAGFTGKGPFPYNASLRNFYSGHISSIVAMANGYFDLGSWNGLTPYVGAGIGMAYNTLSGLNDNGFNYVTITDGGVGATAPAVSQTTGYPSGGYWTNKSRTNVAWALMTGVSYNVSSNLKLELGYRYMNLGTFKSGSQQCYNANGTIGGGGCNYTITTQKLGSHDLRIGMRWMLGETAPVRYAAPAMEQPIVRKY